MLGLLGLLSLFLTPWGYAVAGAAMLLCLVPKSLFPARTRGTDEFAVPVTDTRERRGRAGPVCALLIGILALAFFAYPYLDEAVARWLEPPDTSGAAYLPATAEEILNEPLILSRDSTGAFDASGAEGYGKFRLDAGTHVIVLGQTFDTTQLYVRSGPHQGRRGYVSRKVFGP